MKKEDVITYFLDLKYELTEQISDILYSDITHSLTFGELQKIDHIRNVLNKVYEIIYFLEKGDF